LNEYKYNLSPVVTYVRGSIEERLRGKYEGKRGKKRTLNVVIDLTTLEKTGKFPNLPLSILNKVWGLHIVVLYLSIGKETFPWSFLVWKGKGKGPSPAQLALQQIRHLPKWMSEAFNIRVLVDGGFTSSEFLEGCDWLNYPVIGTIRQDRNIVDGRKICDLEKKGEGVYLTDCSVKVYVSWFKLKRDDGSYEMRYVASTRQLNGEYIAQVGRERWEIEGFFKVMKSRFGLDQFGQRTLKGVIRFICFAFLAYVLSSFNKILDKKGFVDWKQTAQYLRDHLIPWVVAGEAMKALERVAAHFGQSALEFIGQDKSKKPHKECKKHSIIGI
jgi:hypothetical protein